MKPTPPTIEQLNAALTVAKMDEKAFRRFDEWRRLYAEAKTAEEQSQILSGIAEKMFPYEILGDEVEALNP